MQLRFDNYTRNARLLPALIVAIPISVTLAAFGVSVSTAAAGLIGAGSALGLTALLAQLGRDNGKRKEPNLFKQWGGKPSVAKMRHRDQSLNAATRARYITKAKKVLATKRWPTAEDEAQDPETADKTYEALTNVLLERTRNAKQFPLLYAELVNYGFRRNLWGLKPIGLTCSVLSFLAIVLHLTHGFFRQIPVAPISLCAIGIDFVFLLVWSFWITPDWVRLTADAYADRLLGSLEKL